VIELKKLTIKYKNQNPQQKKNGEIKYFHSIN